MSRQRDIVNALITALQGVSGVNKVTQDFKAWSTADPQSLSTLYVNPKKPEVDRMAFLHPTSEDMMANMEIIIEGTVYSQYETDVFEKLDLLMKNVEIAIVTDSSLDGLTIDIYLESDEYVTDVQERFGIFTATYVVGYCYNHLSP